MGKKKKGKLILIHGYFPMDVAAEVKNYMMQGKTLERFLTDFHCRKKIWNKYLSKNKCVQDAVEDGLVYYKAFMQSRLDEMVRRKSGNSTLAKMLFENSLGWTEAALKREKNEKPRKMYKVYVDLGPEPDYEKEQEEKLEKELGLMVDDDTYYPKIGKTEKEVKEIINRKETRDEG